MREIKIRAWDKKEKKYIYDFISYCLNNYKNSYNPWEDDNFVKEQYIGYKDQNEKEIYEGDYNIDDGFLFLVSFKNGVYGYKIYDRGEWGKWIFSEFVPVEAYYADEIDFSYNIHENPELLED